MNKNVFRKTILFLVGFCLYITIECLFRGYSYPLMGICGGIMMIILDTFNNQISWSMDILLQGCLGAVIITLIEFIIGKSLKLLSLPPMWDYSNIPFNIDGIICLPFSLIWVLLSIIGIFIADAINYYVFDELPVPYYKLFGKIVLRFKKKI